MKKITVALILVAIAVASSLWFFPRLPDEIPINSDYNIITISRSVLIWIMPLVMLVIFLIMIIIKNLIKRNIVPARAAEGPFLTVLMMVLLSLLVGHLFILMMGMGYPINEQIIGPLVTGIVFLAIGFILPQMDSKAASHGNMLGVSPNQLAWRRTRVFMSRTLVIGGIAMLVSTLIPSTVLITIVRLVTVLIMAGGIYFYHLKHT